MDILNDYILHPENPDTSTDSEASENERYISRLDSINNGRKRKKNLTCDDFCMKHSSNLWNIWCIIHEYSITSGIFDQLDYASFCILCYENSTKY